VLVSTDGQPLIGFADAERKAAQTGLSMEKLPKSVEDTGEQHGLNPNRFGT
jgi:hypothetical protein